MAASLHRIQLPVLAKSVDEEGDDEIKGIIPDSGVDAYYESIRNDNNNKSALGRGVDETNDKLFCYHAIALGSTVVGNLPSAPIGEASSISDAEWQTNFDAPVLTVASNSSGTVIAAATATHVSLLKGHDGSIIATRQITRSEDDLSMSSPGLVFVTLPPCSTQSSQHHEQSTPVKDVLVIVCPIKRGECNKNNVIIISNIDGEALNSSEPDKFRDAATSMSIDAPQFDYNNNNNLASGDVAATLVEGVFVNDVTIRFFIAHKSGTISVFDYSIKNKESTIVTEDLFQKIGLGTWKLEEHLDMSIDTNSNQGMFLVLAATLQHTSIGWINVVDLSISSNCPIAAGEKLVSLKPLRSRHNECVAVAFSTKTIQSRRKSAKSPKIHVLQSLLGKDGCSQILFTVETDQQVRSVGICTSPGNMAYSFRFLGIIDGQNPGFYNEFNANEQGRVGTVHFLATFQNNFQDAHNIITEELSNYSCCDNISTPIHKSLVWLWKLRHIVSNWKNCGTHSFDEYQQCLRQLTFGAATGDEECTENMIAAAQLMLHWPEKCHNVDISDRPFVSLQDILSTLSIFCSETGKVIDVLRLSPKQTHLEEQNRKLNNRLRAIQGLESVTNSSQIQLNCAYLSVDSVDMLLSVLISQGAFRSAERLQNSEYGKSLSPDSISCAATRIPLHSDPTKFLPWLCDLVIPSLHIGHPMLDYIRAWTCKAAEFYDDEDIFCGIESSISLLEAVSKSTMKLSVAMNSLSSQSAAQIVAAEDKSRSGSENALTAASTHHRPSVLKVGMIRGRKVREGRTFSAQRVSSTPAVTSMLAPSCDLDDLESIEHDCVEQKLNEAIQLKRARDLGVDRDCLKLSNYKSKGDNYVVKELLKSALMKTSLDPSISDLIIDGVRQFANDVGVDFDKAMHQYSIELGDSRKDDIPHYLQDATRLAQWCKSPSVMCLIVLSMLQKALVSIQRPPNLSQIADSAIQSATDDYIKSELKEAARLLSIDYLVRKYCGNGAQEYFRVSNPTHGVRLVQHVCRHIDDESVLHDLLLLCDAFKDISMSNACVSLLERVMTSRGKGRIGQCANIMTALYSRDASLAESVGERATRFCAETLEDCKKHLQQNSFVVEAKRKAKQIVQAACSILSVMVYETRRNRRMGRESAETLAKLKRFETISRLQLDCELYLTLSEAEDSSSCATVVLELLKPSIDLSFAQQSLESPENFCNELKPLMRRAKQWCTALCDSSEAEKVWSHAVGTLSSQIADTSGINASVLLEVSGAFKEGHDAHYQSILSVAMSLCNKAFSQTYELSQSTCSHEDSLSASLAAMDNMVRASQLLRKHIILSCPANALPMTLSMSTLIELVCDVTTSRSDFGVGERLEQEFAILNPTPQNHSSACLKALPPPPILHSSWYIGDGLLLQPTEALLGCVSYCRVVSQLESIGIFFSSDQLVATSNIIQMFETHGAHSTSIRLIAHGNAASISNTSSLLFDSETVVKSKAHCAERSLGGTDAGLTSGSIDSLSSVSFLLELPKEIAFRLYQSALPSAIGNRDCSRTLALSSIGSYLGVGVYYSGDQFSWRTQQRFIDQCNDLSRNATWWNIFSFYDVSFDPSVFSKPLDSSIKETMQSYCEQLVWKATNKLGPGAVLRLARKYTGMFGLDKYCPASALVKFLLSSPDVTETNSQDNGSNNIHDIRCNLILAEDNIRSVIIYLPILNQVKVLRKCVLELEKDERCTKDYDRQAMALLLYHDCLSKLGALLKKSDARKKAHDEEIGRIERRQDALAILSSMFDNYSVEERPAYNKMFEPLPDDPSVLSQSGVQRGGGVLGSFALSCTFDPLAPLHDVLGSTRSSEMLGALDISLCPLLRLPLGYIHARSLIIRLNEMISAGEDLPSFEHIVAPVAKKLAKADDKADLAWWCAQQYCIGSKEQLKCLDLAYTNATLASDEVESTGQRSDDERMALDRVQKIDSARAGLSDKVLTEEVLHRHDLTTQVKSLYNEILREVQLTVNANENYSPELLVRELLIQASLTAATAALDECNNLTITGFRSLALVVHDACQSLADRYSHVSVGKIARHLMRQWLAHGDEAKISDEVENCIPEYSERLEEEELDMSVRNEDGDEPSEFVMDMKIFSSSEQSWTKNSSSKETSGLSSSEEPSSIRPFSSLKEKYDLLNSRVSLRIAFTICFVKDFHRHKDLSQEDDDDENTDMNAKLNNSVLATKKQRASFFEGDLAMHHARELLSIVFAREGKSAHSSSCRPLFDESVSFDSSILSTIQEDRSYIKEDSRGVNKALSFSFAMRHRAMRVASILCPHDVIVRVLTEEGHVSKTTVDVINKTMFGSFVATEIESMGLPLPHSDLIQLSSMNFASYARTIWRHHGGVSSRGLSGRFYLLVLNLCIHNHTTIDWELFLSIFSELKRLELTRSLLLACEYAVESKAVELAASEDRSDVLTCVRDAVSTIFKINIEEIRSNIETGLGQNLHDCLPTLHRLASVIITDTLQLDPISFVDEYMTMSSYCQDGKHSDLSQGFSDVAERILAHLTDPEKFSSAFTRIKSTPSANESEHVIVDKKVESTQLENANDDIEEFEQRF